MIKLPPKATGTVTAAQYNALLAVVEQLAADSAGKLRVGPSLEMKQGASDTVLSVAPAVMDNSFWAEITSATAVGDRWKYSWQEVRKTGDGYTSAWEVPSGGSGRTGSANAYNGDEIATADYDAVPTGTIVRMRKCAKAESMTADEWWFCSNEDAGGGTGTDSGFWGIITAKTADTDRWKYTLSEADKNDVGYAGWIPKVGGVSGVYAWNAAEFPDPTGKWRPVPVDSVVWVRQVGSEYWFNESMNQDVNTDIASFVSLAFTNTPGAQATTWGLVADKGKGCEKYYCSGLYWDTSTGELVAMVRKETIDDGGRVISIGAGATSVIITGRECPA